MEYKTRINMVVTILNTKIHVNNITIMISEYADPSLGEILNLKLKYLVGMDLELTNLHNVDLYTVIFSKPNLY